MPEFHLLCLYCGHRFSEYVYSLDGADKVRCPKCGDKSLKDETSSEESRDVFGYNYKEKK